MPATPLSRMAASDALPSAVPHVPSILVIDPDPGTQRLLHVVLQPQGSLHPAASIEEAHAWLTQYRPQLIIASLELPGAARGLGLLPTLRQLGMPLPPVIGLTSTGWRSERTRYLRHGLTACLLKPFTVAELRATVRDLLA
jgi:CheY-like chemotaxis protein